MEEPAIYCLPSVIVEKLKPLLTLGSPDWSLFENSNHAKLTLVFKKPTVRRRSPAKCRRDRLRVQTKYLSSHVHAETQTSDVLSMDLSCSPPLSPPLPSPVIPTPLRLELSPRTAGFTCVDDAVVPDSPTADLTCETVLDSVMPPASCPSPVSPTSPCPESLLCVADVCASDAVENRSSPPAFVPMDFDCTLDPPVWKKKKKKKKKKNLFVSNPHVISPIPESYAPVISPAASPVYVPTYSPSTFVASPVSPMIHCPFYSPSYLPDTSPPVYAASPVYIPEVSVFSPAYKPIPRPRHVFRPLYP